MSKAGAPLSEADIVPSAPPATFDHPNSGTGYNASPYSSSHSPCASAPPDIAIEPGTTSATATTAPPATADYPFAAAIPCSAASAPPIYAGSSFVTYADYPTSTSAFPSASAYASPLGSTTAIPASTTSPQQTDSTVPLGLIGSLGRTPKRLKCHCCQQESVTRTSLRIDWVTVLAVILMLMIFWPLFWLPLVIPCCYTTVHTCPNCHQRLGHTPPCGE